MVSLIAMDQLLAAGARHAGSSTHTAGGMQAARACCSTSTGGSAGGGTGGGQSVGLPLRVLPLAQAQEVGEHAAVEHGLSCRRLRPAAQTDEAVHNTARLRQSQQTTSGDTDQSRARLNRRHLTQPSAAHADAADALQANVGPVAAAVGTPQATYCALHGANALHEQTTTQERNVQLTFRL